jgi:hypothetical protein
MSTFQDVVFYLAGPIDAAADEGIGWRRQIRNWAADLELGIKFIDPSDKPPIFRKETSHEKVEIKDLKKRGNWREIVMRVKDLQRHDLRAVDIADVVVAYVDHDVHMCGTYFEVQRAHSQGKPMFLVVKGGRAKCPPWLFGLVDPSHMFDSLEDCLAEIETMSHDPLPPDWILLKHWVK